jgi:hypothetical protein
VGASVAQATILSATFTSADKGTLAVHVQTLKADSQQSRPGHGSVKLWGVFNVVLSSNRGSHELQQSVVIESRL